MDINEYILLTKNLNNEALISSTKSLYAFDKEKNDMQLKSEPLAILKKAGLLSDLFEFSKKAFKNLGNSVQVIPLYSSSIYPEIVMQGNNFNILWDLCFWDLCEAFFKYTYLFKEHKDIGDHLTELYEQDLIYFISNKLEIYPELSYTLAVDYYSKRNDMQYRIYHCESAELDYM